MKHVLALYEEERAEEAYRVYVTDSLKLSGEGKYISERFHDLMHPPEEIDAEAIIDDVIERAGLEVIE